MTPASLKVRRKVIDVSQFALAAASGVSRSKIQLYEQGFGALTEDDKTKLEKHLSKKEASHGRKIQKK